MSNDLTFDQFIAVLPAERQNPVRQLWQVVRQAVPTGYTEHVGPKYLEFRAGPEVYVALASQKNYMSFHMVPMYVIPELRERLAAAAPTLKTGKGCINFKRLEELPLAALADIIGATSADDYVARLRAMRGK